MPTEIEGDRELLDAFERMVRAGGNPRVYLNAIGDMLTESTQLRFESSRGTDGSPWRAVLRGGQPLLHKGQLRASVSHQVQGDSSVVVGVPYAWASVHQFGAIIRAKIQGKNLRFKVGASPTGIGGRWVSKKEVTIPARPFLGISDNDRSQITEILRSVITRD
jgi:phage gpG-like protein